MSQRQPIFNAPMVVIALTSVLVALHAGRALLPEVVDERVLQLLAFIPDRLGAHAADFPGGSVAAATQYVTYMFLHGNLAHLLVNSVCFLAFATPIARRIGTPRFLAVFLLCGIGGALLFVTLNSAPMLGASGAISGFQGAALRFLYLPLRARDADALAGHWDPPLLTLAQSFNDRDIVVALVGWTALNLLAAYGAQELIEDGSIAWEAHLGGFFTGFLTFGLFDNPPPGSQQLDRI